MALERRGRNADAGKIPELAARLRVAVGAGGVGKDAFRPGRGIPALQAQRPVQRDVDAAAPAAAELRPLDLDLPKARRERLPDPAVPFHRPPAVRAGRGRKLGVERLEQGRAAPRPGAEHAVADRRLERVQVRNPAASQLRPHPRKRTAERRSGRRKQRLQLRRADARRLPDLAAAHAAALPPILHANAAGLADHGRMLRRLLVRQALQIRHRVRMAELRILLLACHDASDARARMRGARRSRVFGSRAGTAQSWPAEARLQPPARRSRPMPETAEQARRPQKMGCTPKELPVGKSKILAVTSGGLAKDTP